MTITTNFFNRIFLTTFFLACFIVITHNTNAQATEKSKVNLSEQEWKAVQGIFQSPQNNDMNVQFTVKDNMLVAKLLWNNNELHLLPESPLDFQSNQEGNQEPVHIAFIKDSSGTINQVNVAGNGVWKRNDNYKPLSKKQIELMPEELKQFEGLYQLRDDGSRFIQFFVKGKELILKQEWDGEQRSFVAESNMDFFIKDFPLFTLNFSKDKDGNIGQVTAFKRDVWIKTKKPSLTAAQLKSYEGKYQSNDDPDNLIQLFVSDGHLVIKQLWDKKEIILEPKTDTYFYNEADSYPLVILKNKDGKVNQLTVLGTNIFNKLK